MLALSEFWSVLARLEFGAYCMLVGFVQQVEEYLGTKLAMDELQPISMRSSSASPRGTYDERRLNEPRTG